jgi:methylenetetrahydrofolate dehydrogenase (NADP+)/methenyltetrahydrofolate cyclohydrolase
MAHIIDGKKISIEIKDEVKKEVETLLEKGITPCLAVILVGENPASQVYVRNKKKACEYVGIKSLSYELSSDTTEDELLKLIDGLNKNPEVNGILVQLPLPGHIDEEKILLAVSPEKDVDGFHPYNVGLLSIGNAVLKACTPAGCIELIKRSGIEIIGKKCVVIGRSNIVGKPVSMLLLAENGTVSVCHSKTRDINEEIKNADIVIAAVGKPKFVKGDMISDGAVIIDVGINRMENGKLCGDVDFDECEKKASFITPVPGGVGPMTIAMLMKNCLSACKSQNN